MSKGRMPKLEVVKACQKGVITAQNEYAKMAGESLWYGPEYFITTHVAQSLFKSTGSKYVTLENSAYNGLYNANALGRGCLHSDLRANGRFDILLWWANESPRAVIEIKNRVTNKTQYEADLKRIKSTLSRKSNESTLEFGIFSFYTSASDSDYINKTGEDTLKQRLLTIENNMEEILGEQFTVKLESKINYCAIGEAYWAAVSALIERA